MLAFSFFCEVKLSMSVFVPNLILKDVTSIDIKLLNKYNIKALILDVDNTLTIHGSQEIDEKVLDWLIEMKKNGIGLMLVSNNSHERIEPFAKKIGLPFIAMGLKPFTFGFTKAKSIFKLESSQIAVVGDQIYTDILGGNIKGLFTILVYPFVLEQNFFFKLKRSFEKTHIKKYFKALKKEEKSEK